MTEIAVKQTLRVLREGLDGPAEGPSYYLDTNAGLRTTLAGLSAEEASRPWGGNSVAAHAHHLLFSFDAFAAYVNGDRTQRDWDQSWSVNTVDDAAWTKLQEDIVRGYEALRDAIKAHGHEGPEAFGSALAAVTHLAYHIGAIRQKVAAAKE
ncbi:MAG TPA: DinB family protein [Thermoanaerobaculia bacterium]|nr:DinB family protein [Thermoanaerobaculia bacterium]